MTPQLQEPTTEWIISNSRLRVTDYPGLPAMAEETYRDGVLSLSTPIPCFENDVTGSSMGFVMDSRLSTLTTRSTSMPDGRSETEEVDEIFVKRPLAELLSIDIRVSVTLTLSATEDKKA
ncbi:unnamed protein product [Phytophthora lilii]|uniref:Unnamed protein product n=1 Tax=Phytophthora lilii TaxID=2077276 RepID=A0A9W7CQ03_9STRA|nr:unnamed protein product [Phytophthora lilii]